MKLKGNTEQTNTEDTPMILKKLISLSEDLMVANDDLREYAEKHAYAENDYGKAKAKAFLLASGKNKEEREANADSYLSEERLTALLAKGKKESQLERVRSLRQVLSSVQTFINSEKSVSDMLNFNQDYTT